MWKRLKEAMAPRRELRRSAWGALYDDERGDVPGWVLITLMNGA
ncbi:hypothetical protein [Microbacterium sp. cx-59]|nr:hypothetical protein [Microbacterium sp. cx-59]